MPLPSLPLVAPTLASSYNGQTPAAVYTPTTSLEQGPYYPGRDAFAQASSDLTSDGRAQGDALVIDGSVRDAAGAPVAGAEVQIWQADATGKYRQDAEPKDALFRGIGKAVTDEQGRYRFHTILPPHYPAAETWDRSRHVHIAVYVPGKEAFFTEMHFELDEKLGQDEVLRELDAEALRRILVEPHAFEGGLRAEFVVVLPR